MKVVRYVNGHWSRQAGCHSHVYDPPPHNESNSCANSILKSLQSRYRYSLDKNNSCQLTCVTLTIELPTCKWAQHFGKRIKQNYSTVTQWSTKSFIQWCWCRSCKFGQNPAPPIKKKWCPAYIFVQMSITIKNCWFCFWTFKLLQNEFKQNISSEKKSAKMQKPLQGRSIIRHAHVNSTSSMKMLLF